MNPIVLIFLAASVVWALVVLRRGPTIQPVVILVGLAVYLFAQIFFGYEFFHVDVGPIPLTIDRVVLAVVTGLWLYYLWRNLGGKLQLDRCDVIVLFWFGVIGLSTLLGDYQFRNNLPLSRLLFFNFFPLLVYGIVKHTAWEPQHLRWLIRVWLVFATLLGLLAIAEWRAWHDLVYPRYIVSEKFEEFLGRGRGPLLNPVINGSLMILGLAALLTELPESRRKYWPAWVMLLLVLGGGIFATLTRSVWMAAAMVAGVYVIAWSTPRWRVALVCGALILGVFAYTIGFEVLNQFKRDRNVSVEDMSDSIRLRPLFAAVAWEMFQEKPITGFGFGLYHKYKLPYHYTDEYHLPIRKALDYTQHNVFLSYLVEVGLIGCGALMAMLGVLVVGSWSMIKTAASGTSASARFGYFGLAVVIVYVVNGLFHDVSLIPMANCLLLFGQGLIGRVAFSTVVGSPQMPGIEGQNVNPQQKIGEHMSGHAIP